MVLDIPDEQYGHSIAVASGNKAGLLVVRLPVESRLPGTWGLSREWVVKNWAKWIYPDRSEEHTSELQSLMRISYAVFCLKKKKKKTDIRDIKTQSNNSNDKDKEKVTK